MSLSRDLHFSIVLPPHGCRPPSRTSAYFGRQHFFLKYLFTFGTASTLAAVSRYFLEYPAVLKYKDIRRGAAARCSFKVAVVSSNRPSGHMGTPSGETKPKKRQNYSQASFLCFFPLVSKPRVGLPNQEVGRSPRGLLDTTEVAVSGSQESVFAQAGVQVPRPSGLAERQTTHLASGTDECKRTVQECARDSPSLEYRG